MVGHCLRCHLNNYVQCVVRAIIRCCGSVVKAPLKFEPTPKILLYQTSSPAIQAHTTDHQLSHAALVPTDGYDPALVERYFEALPFCFLFHVFTTFASP